jgi:hypothetical protein
MTIKEIQSVNEMTSDRTTLIGQNYTSDQLKSLVDRLKDESGKYLNIYKKIGRVLWRGVKNYNALAYESHSPLNRKPLSSPKQASDIFNNALVDLKFKATRNNSIFTTGDLWHATHYGKPFVIIPKSGADFTWGQTKNAVDLVIFWAEIKPILKDDGSDQIDLDKFTEKYDFDQTDFAGAVRSGHEVMISGEYFAVHYNLWKEMIEQGLLPKKLNYSEHLMQLL